MKLKLLLVLFLISDIVNSQIPAGYYDAANGKTGYELKTALKDIITNGHNDQGYNALYTLYQSSDVDNYYENDQTLLDMYSEVPSGPDSYEYTQTGDKCGSYQGEGGCYNREHIMPQSVFNSASPMKSDGHFVVPADGYVNNRRSNYAFGVVTNPTWTSTNGSKVGPNATAGYTDTVFEPIDEFKGDIARMLFYFATRYEDQVASWSHPMLNGTSDQVFSDWFLDILLQWNTDDPVSQREIDRNNAVYNFQGNRNPFIDHPEWVNEIWNNNQNNGNGGGGSGNGNPSASQVIAIQDFDGTTPDWSYTEYDSGYNCFNIANNYQGNTTNSLQIKGTNGHNADPYIELANVDLTSYNNVKLWVYFAANGPDTSDDLYIDYSFDNGASWTNVKLVDGYGNTNLSFGDTNASNPTTVSPNPYSIDIPDTETQIMVRIRFDERGSKNNTSDYYFVDDIKLVGDSTSNGPSITNITQNPTTVTSSDTVSVSADVTDPDGIGGVELHWGTTSGSLNNTINMSLSSGNTYTTDSNIPAQVDGTTVYYEIYALDNNADDTTSSEQSYTVNDNPPCASELIISEYIEGSSNNKYLELYNGTGNTVNMDNYDVRIYANGASSPSTTINLTNTNLADGSVFVLAHSSATAWSGTPDQTSGSLTFNGDDAVELYNTATGQSVDIIGKIGQDPGSQWGSGSTTTKDHTLVRKATVTAGDTNGSDAFDPAVEWDGFAVDDVSHLGSHTMTCTTCVEPTSDAVFHANSPQNITTTSLTLNWTNGDGDNRIVVLREANPVTFVPVDGTTYTGNSDYSAATDVSGNGEYVVYNGNGSTVDITGLTPGTLYYAVIYEYNCAPGSEDYYTSGTPATDSFYTTPETPDTFVADCVGLTSIDLSWTAPATGNFDGYLVVAREGATPHSVNSLDPNSNLGENTDYSAAATYGTSTPNSHILYKGTATSATITGLTNGTSYTFEIFAYATNGTLYRYSAGKQLTKTIELNNVTAPLTSGANQQVTVTWTNPGNTCFDEILVVANETAGIDFTPSGDGSAYTANSNYAGVNSIVYKGTGNQITVTGLTNGTTYYFEIFVRKGTDWSTGVEVSGVPNDITILEPGDLAILAVNTDIDNDPGGNGNGSGDEIAFVCFKDINPGTKIYLTDNGYEREVAGKWGNTEGVIAITRLNTTLTKGTIIVLETNANTNGNILDPSHFDIYTCGAIDSDWQKEFVGGQGGFNLNNDDDVWIMQGGIWNNGTAGNHDATYNGNVLYGWTESGWNNGVGNGTNGTKWSNLYPNSKCFTTVAPTGDGKVKFNDPNDPDFSTTTNDRLDWIALINTTGNWDTYTTNADYNAGGYDYKNNTTCPAMTIANNVHTAGKWNGTNNTNWFDCSNWDTLTVPDENTDVTISGSAGNQAVVDATAADSDLYSDIAKTANLTIENGLWIEVLNDADILEIHGNLTIASGASLDLDGASTTQDGHIKIYGNWINQATEADVYEGQSSIEFLGTVPQSVTCNSGNETEKFYNLTINNPSGVTFASGNIHAQHDLNILQDTPVDITDGHYLLAGHNLVNNVDITIENQGSLVQTDDAGSITGTGTFKLNKTSLPLNNYWEYVYWSSPLNSTTFTLGDIVSNAWRYYKFDPNQANNGHTYPGWVMLSAADIPQKGIGYAISAPNGTGSNLIISSSFVKNNDPFNNGAITVSILKKGGPGLIGDFNLLGNPYPSAIDFNALANDNAAINGAYYLWTNCAGLSGNHHQDSGYTTYSVSGTSVQACTNGAQAGRYIATAQGFMVEANTDNANLTFHNSHRVLGNNDGFLNRPTQNRDILWLDMKDDSGKFSQIAVGFYDGASTGFDRLFDARSMNAGNGYALYAVNGNDKLVIQALPNQNIENAIVPLGVEITNTADVSLQLNHTEGFENFDIYLKDKLTGTIHNLKTGAYTIHLDQGIYENRFELIFNRILGVDETSNNPGLLISQHKAMFKLWYANDTKIQQVMVFDVTGQLLFEKNNINSHEININLQQVANGNLLIFKVLDDKGRIAVKKAVKL